MKIGLIAGSYKPFHAGHMGLIEIASKENDEVHLFVSTSDRKRPGEIAILGSDMTNIWKVYLEPIMPDNVVIKYGGSPVANVYVELGEANEQGSKNTFAIYADPTDLSQNFSNISLNKYAGNLLSNKQIKLRPIQRTQTKDVSGTKMREYLATGDAASFISNLPDGVDGSAIWDILSSAKLSVVTPKQKVSKKIAQKESLLHSYITLLIK